MPLEDDLRNDYLTSTFEGHEDVTLLDCFVLGFLKLKSPSRLKTVDFRGFAGGGVSFGSFLVKWFFMGGFLCVWLGLKIRFEYFFR